MDPLADKNDIANDASLVKDSTWIYLSETADTIKKIKFKNDIEVK
jgi:hypothetical protein